MEKRYCILKIHDTILSMPIGKTFIVNGDDKVKQGYISLQSNSHPWIFVRLRSWSIEDLITFFALKQRK
jgi:hypothetical protein